MNKPSEAKLYHWNELARESVRRGVERCAFRGDNVIMVMNWLQPGMDVKPHKHPFEQIVYIVSGHARFHVGDEVVEAGPGSIMRIPPDVMHFAEPVGDEPVVDVDVFSPIREDYRHLVAYQEADFGTAGDQDG